MTNKILTLLMALALLGAPAALAQCDSYTEGDDSFENSSVQGVVRFPGGSFPVDARGPFLVRRGTPSIGSDGRCQQPILMVSMNVSAQTPLGIITLTTYPGCPIDDPNLCNQDMINLGCACGTITEQQPGTGFPADSFFNLSLQAQGERLPQPLCNFVPGRGGQPAKPRARITSTPPNPEEDYAEEILELLACESGLPANVQILNPIHKPYAP